MATVANDRARDAARVAADQVQGVAGTAAERTQDLAGTIKQEASRVTDEVTTQVRSLTEETKSQVEAQVREAASRVGHGFYQLAEEAQALAEGRPADAPNLGEYVGRAAERLFAASDGINGLAETIDQRGIEGLVTDVQRFARRRPAAFLLGATVAGFGVGRMIRNRDAASPPAPGGDGRQPPLREPPVRAPAPPPMRVGGR
ncbi:MAG TPA: hypothetical protein VHT75_10160 [Acidimicrobiales bacterium]|nr:hypothetical protein [Acidimicrobiales bacterium]